MHTQATSPSPFSCTFSPSIPAILSKLNCSLAISTYQAGKIVFISPKNEREIIQLPRTFPKAMGIGLEGNKMVVATQDEVIILANAPQLAQHYPAKPATYDALFMPRATYYTGQIDIHDIDLSDGKIYGVNTSFSCLIEVDDDYNFRPIWQPTFITKLASEDRCHLNGMAMRDGKPRYVTAFAATDTPQGWRKDITKTGIIIDIETNEIIADNLAMPHSPRWFDSHLYVLLSATGELLKINPDTKEKTVVCQVKGFVRGLSKIGDYLFIGLSKFRESSKTFQELNSRAAAKYPGILCLHLPSQKIVGEIAYQNSVEEIYDVQVLPNMRRPGILNTLKGTHKMGLSTPEASYWARAGQGK